QKVCAHYHLLLTNSFNSHIIHSFNAFDNIFASKSNIWLDTQIEYEYVIEAKRGIKGIKRIKQYNNY
ncbi:TPA: hypothetical protein DCZ16_04055, partial [Candidatus Peregrinibacteria bacterium]|nr:hypothetical protein [Candidatus Peregrinibacteria bacterium]